MTTARVLVAGDANLDLVLRGDVVPRFGQVEQLLESAELVLGSSAGICAAGLARLGVDVSLVARIGADLFGDETSRLLSAAGVDTRAVRRVDEGTGFSVILSSADRAILTFTGALAGLTADEVADAVTSAEATHLHVASYFLVPELARELPGVLARVRERGVTTSLDTNWDPAERWAGVAECLPHLDLLLPNAQEAVALARALGGDPADAVAAAKLLADRGPIVVVKDGADGGFAVAEGRVVRAAGLTVDVVDTTGAGDSFDAGFLAAWLDGRDLAEAVRWATIAGSLSTGGTGGTGHQATRAEILAETGAETGA